MAHVTVAQDIFAHASELTDGGWELDPAFLVLSSDVEGAAAALHAAGERFLLIDERGREVDDWDCSESYTPNYVSKVYLTADGPLVWVDVKGWLSQDMGRRMLDVLVAELVERGVSAHVTAPAPGSWLDVPTWSLPTEQASPDGTPSEGLSRSWYIGRSVRTRTTTGREYEEMLWRDPDGTWSASRTSAERFGDPPDSLVRSLRQQPLEPGAGEVTGFLLADDNSDPHPMPPEAIRRRPSPQV
jgi:hypothetical protein